MVEKSEKLMRKDDCIIMVIMQCLTKFKSRSRAKGMTDHQSRKTMMRAKAQMRNRAFSRKNGANLAKIIISLLSYTVITKIST